MVSDYEYSPKSESIYPALACGQNVIYFYLQLNTVEVKIDPLDQHFGQTNPNVFYFYLHLNKTYTRYEFLIQVMLKSVVIFFKFITLI